MAMHFPIFSLRLYPTSVARHELSSNRWIDLSFLKIRKRKPTVPTQKEYAIRETQLSIVICGHDRFQWTAYAFDDTMDPDCSEQDFNDRFPPRQDSSEVTPSEGAHDLIAWEDFENVMDPNRPFWDPREYFIRILQSRAAQLSKEWDELAARIVKGIEEDIEVCSISDHVDVDRFDIDRLPRQTVAAPTQDL